MNALVEALVAGCDEKFREQALCIDYAKHFQDFWGPDDTPKVLTDLSGRKDLIVVWKEMPKGEGADRLLAEHLTPLDWALAISQKLTAAQQLRTEEPEQLNSEPAISEQLTDAKTIDDLRIHIVDLTCLEYESSFAVSAHLMILNEMPWVRLYAPLTGDYGSTLKRLRAGYRPLMAEKGALLTPKGDLAIAATLPQHIPDPNRFKRLNSLWRGGILESDDHHDLNNLVMPKILDIAMFVGQAVDGTKFQDAFATRIKWCAMLDNIYRAGAISDVEIDGDLDIFVVDDQLKSGWDAIVARLFGFEAIQRDTYESLKFRTISEKSIKGGQQSLYGTSGGDCLLDALGINRTLKKWSVDQSFYRRRTYDSPNRDEANPRPWILALDLRLFVGQKSNERAWFKGLLDVAKELGEDKSYAWPGFAEDEIALLQGWLDPENAVRSAEECAVGHQPADSDSDEMFPGSQSTSVQMSGYGVALTLLPRLCALRWPATPILVFSATGRHGVLSQLSLYGNILFGVRKPNLAGGNLADQAQMFWDGWKENLRGARAILVVQRKLLGLMRQSTISGPEGTALLPRATHKHVVISIDETGDFSTYPKSMVGGVIAIFGGESKEAAIKSSVNFQESLRKFGVNFYERVPYYPETNDFGIHQADIQPKNHDVSSAVEQACTAHGTKIFGFACSVDKRNYSNKSMGYRDQAFLTAISRCIELIAVDLLPTLGIKWNENDNKTSVSLWVATRVHDEESPELATATAKRFDLRHVMRGNLVESIGGDGAGYAITLSALSGRGIIDSFSAAISTLRLRKLPYTKDITRYSSARQWVCQTCSNSTSLTLRDEQAMGLCEVGKNTGRACNGKLAAEYSVMGHVADSILSPMSFPKRGCGDFLEARGSFHFEANDRSLDFLHASRLIDAKRNEDAFQLAAKHDFFVTGINSGDWAKAKLHSRLVTEFLSVAGTVSGWTLASLIGVHAVRPGTGGAFGHSSKAASSRDRARTQRLKHFSAAPAAGKTPSVVEDKLSAHTPTMPPNLVIELTAFGEDVKDPNLDISDLDSVNKHLSRIGLGLLQSPRVERSNRSKNLVVKFELKDQPAAACKQLLAIMTTGQFSVIPGFKRLSQLLLAASQ